MIVGTRFDLDRLLGAGLVEHFDGGDAAVGDALDLGRPTRRNVAALHPIIDDRAIELEGARDLGLASEYFDEALGAIHARSLTCQNYFDNRLPPETGGLDG